jgi:hypothetical protein
MSLVSHVRLYRRTSARRLILAIALILVIDLGPVRKSVPEGDGTATEGQARG